MELTRCQIPVDKAFFLYLISLPPIKTYKYATGRKHFVQLSSGEKEVLHDFSLSLERGRVYGLLGKNGAGKSTLLYLMSGLLTPKSGKIMYHDTDVRRRLPITLQDMFLVPEEFELPPISLVSYVELNSQFYPRFSKEEYGEIFALL